MAAKPVIISSSGLKNIVLNKYKDDDDFVFVFGEVTFQMKNIFAEFISPIVSRIHQTDPIINSINFCDINGVKQNDFNKFSKSLITPDIISLLHQISGGSSIEINEDQATKIRILSIFLGNDELHRKMSQLFPTNYNEENISMYVRNIDCLCQFSKFDEAIDITSIISFIASHFYIVDIEEFLKVSRKIQYKIISHSELQIESEDILFDIISQIIVNGKKDDDEIEDILFLEQIEFQSLSELKFSEFVSSFDFNNMSGQLWQNLCQCFFPHQIKKFPRKQRKNECIIVCGFDKYNQLGVKPNNVAQNGDLIISPPMKFSFDFSSLLSYSVYFSHSVLVMSDGSLKGIGQNHNGQISSTLQKTDIKDFTDFCIKDGSGLQLAAISAICYMGGTLYMLSKNSGNERQLVLCDSSINGGAPIFLDIGNHYSVSLFGGMLHLASIGSEGEVIFIFLNSIKNSPNSPIVSVSLPDGEKASSVACCIDSIIVLSAKGRVFSSKIGPILNFSIVSELSDQEIVCVSGTSSHFLAVSKEGRVFGRGGNRYGQLGLGKETESVSLFTKISSLSGYEIRSVYAGNMHSLFVTREGKILSCGYNKFGQCYLSIDSNEEFFFSPTETTITSGASFCIAGWNISASFIGSSPPPNTPNTRIPLKKM